MPAVKRRPYNSPRRREQAAATRAVILKAARRLFERDGYAATTIASVASEAGVAVKTVYVAFETKSGLLRALWNQLLRGDEGDVPVAARQWYREAVEEPDPERQLLLNARNSRAVKTRIAAMLDVIRTAATADTDIETLWARIQTEFHANQRVIVESLDEKKALKQGLGVDRATDILWALNHPDVWQLLVRECGWTPEEYEQWFGETARTLLLR